MADITVTDTPASVGFSIYIGDTFTRDVTVSEDDVLLDISADTFKMRFVSPAGTLFDLSVGSGLTHVSTGRLRITLTAAQTATIPANAELRADLQWTRASDGTVKTLFVMTGRATTDITPAT